MWIERPRRPRAQAGLTLVELILFIVIVSIALAGIVQLMRMTTANSADPLRRKQALMIAEALLEEVRQAGFTFCDPASANAETAQNTAECALREDFGNEGPAGTVFLRPFDNVNDYGAAGGAAVAAFNNGGGLTDALGRPLNLAGYSATVAVIPDALGDIVAGAGADSDALRIRIVVDYEGADPPVTLDGYRARYLPIPRSE